MDDFRNPENVSLTKLKAIVDEGTPVPLAEEAASPDVPPDETVEEEHSIKDKFGNDYSLRFTRSEDLWVMKLLDKQLLVGQANCLCHSTESLFLSDIQIFNCVTFPRQWWCKMMRLNSV